MIALVKPINRDKTFKPTGLSPIEERILIKVLIKNRKCTFENCLNLAFGLFVAVGIYGKDLANKQVCPHIVRCPLIIGTGANPSVGRNAVNYSVYVSVSIGDKCLILEYVCKRNKSVEPVRNAFPTVALSAYPSAVSDIGPYLLKIAAESVGL
jgi:hypothetical protein